MCPPAEEKAAAECSGKRAGRSGGTPPVHPPSLHNHKAELLFCLVHIAPNFPTLLLTIDTINMTTATH